MISKILHFSVGEKTSKLQERCIKRATELHPDWEIKVWRDPVDRSEFELSGYWDKANSGAQLADLIRLEVIYKFGGFYLDSDVYMERSLDEIVACKKLVICTEDGNRLTNAVFGACAGNTVLRELIDELKQNEPDWRVPPNVTTGPELFTRMLFWRNEDYYLLPPVVFYPYESHEFAKKISHSTLGTHLWDASWKVSRIERLRSFLARRRHQINITVQRLRLLLETNYIFLRMKPKVEAFGMADRIIRRSVHKYFVELHGNDISITPEFVRHGYYELSDEIFVIRNLKRGDYFVDVGANVGIYSMLAARHVGDFGRVIAFEPNPKLTKSIGRSAVANWVHNRIKIEQLGVGSKCGKLTLALSENSLGGASFVENTDKTGFQRMTRNLADDQTEIEADIVSLDDYFHVPHEIKFLKIDAEGFEAEVLEGARGLFKSRRVRYLLIELIKDINPNGWNALKEQLLYIHNAGYKPYFINRFGKLKPASLRNILDGKVECGRNVVFQLTE